MTHTEKEARGKWTTWRWVGEAIMPAASALGSVLTFASSDYTASIAFLFAAFGWGFAVAFKYLCDQALDTAKKANANTDDLFRIIGLDVDEFKSKRAGSPTP